MPEVILAYLDFFHELVRVMSMSHLKEFEFHRNMVGGVLSIRLLSMLIETARPA